MFKTKILILITAVLTLFSISSFAADNNIEIIDAANDFGIVSASGEDEGFAIIQADDLEWDESRNELQQKVIYGDPSKEGLYILRARFPAGVTSRPHFHSQDRFVSVIEGTWYAGTDASHDMNRTTEISSGGFMFHPAGAVHFDGANHEAPVIVEIRGMGPVVTEAVPITP
jgi:quercetin dioxygenase-like cupin family protein